MATSIEIRGRTVEEAINKGLQELGVARDQVDVELMNEGSRGLFGLGGTEAVAAQAAVAMPTSRAKAFMALFDLTYPIAQAPAGGAEGPGRGAGCACRGPPGEAARRRTIRDDGRGRPRRGQHGRHRVTLLPVRSGVHDDLGDDRCSELASVEERLQGPHRLVEAHVLIDCQRQPARTRIGSRSCRST